MGKLHRVVMSLSATVKSGRYIKQIKAYDIKKETEKTVTYILEGPHQVVNRISKSLILEPISDYRNDKITNIQFYTYYYPEDKEKASKVLETAIKDAVNELTRINNLAIIALNQGPLNIES